MKFTFMKAFFASVMYVSAIMAVDGISVTGHWNGGGDDNLYGNFGVIMRHDIENDVPTRHIKISNGPGRQPVISPDGKMVAYLHQNNDVRLLTIDGKDERTIGTGHGQACIQFPLNDWVYYDVVAPLTNETHIKRTNIKTGETEKVVQYSKGVWRWGIALDGKKMMVRYGEGSKRGIAYWPDITNPPTKFDQVLANSVDGGCGLAFGANGKYWAHHGGHDDLRVYDWMSDQPFFDKPLSELNDWGPETGNKTNRNNWSRNSDDWICFGEGDAYRGTKNRNQVLYNWKREIKINVTGNSESNPGSDDCGDFWVGGVDPMPDLPRIGLNIAELKFEAPKDGSVPESKSVAIQNSGSGDLNDVSTSIAYDSEDGWLDIVRSGDGNNQTLENVIQTTSLPAGTYTATVTITCNNASPEQETYTISYTLSDDNEPDLDYVKEFLALQKDGSSYLPSSLRSYPESIEDAQPAEGDKLSVDGTSYTWNSVTDEDGMWVDDNGKDDFVAWFALTITVSEETNALIAARHDDDLTMWVNGSLESEMSGYDGGSEEQSDPFTLQNGANTILFRLVEGNGGNHFAVRFLSGDGEALDNATYSTGPVEAPLLTMISPNGGEKFVLGETVTVKWEGNTEKIGTVSLFLSVDEDHLLWSLIHEDRGIDATSDEWANFSWTIPDKIQTGDGEIVSTLSTHCKLKVAAYNDLEKFDISDSPFTIVGTGGENSVLPKHSHLKKPVVNYEKGTLVCRNFTEPVQLVLFDLSGRQLVKTNVFQRTAALRLPIKDIHSGVCVLQVRGSTGHVLFETSIMPGVQ